MAPPPSRRPSFRWGGVATPCLLGLVVRTSNLVGGVRLGQPAASGCFPPALRRAPEQPRLRKVRGGEFACVTRAGPEEAERGRAPEGHLRTALTGVPLSHCPAVSGWCLRRRLAPYFRAPWPQDGCGVGVGEVAARVNLTRVLEARRGLVRTRLVGGLWRPSPSRFSSGGWEPRSANVRALGRYFIYVFLG